MEIDTINIILVAIPVSLMIITASIKIIKELKKPMKMIEELTENMSTFKINNKFNRKELISELKFEILENYSQNHEKISLLEVEIKRVSEKCDIFNSLYKDTSNIK